MSTSDASPSKRRTRSNSIPDTVPLFAWDKLEHPAKRRKLSRFRRPIHAEESVLDDDGPTAGPSDAYRSVSAQNSENLQNDGCRPRHRGDPPPPIPRQYKDSDHTETEGEGFVSDAEFDDNPWTSEPESVEGEETDDSAKDIDEFHELPTTSDGPDDTLDYAEDTDMLDTVATSLPSILPEHLHEAFKAQKIAVVRALQNPSLPLDDPDGPTRSKQQLRDILTGSINRGEGNSCLLIGPKACGKTLALEEVLRCLPSDPIVVRLCGHVQVNDRLAMKEIVKQVSRQLGSQWGREVLDDKVDDNLSDFTVLPPAAHLPSLITSLPNLPRPAIIILDSFDMFTTHPRQALLYCLFDTVQSLRPGLSSSGLAVVGVTARLDVLTLLEKRVKSRFSHRSLQFHPPSSVDAVVSSARMALIASPPISPPEWSEYWTKSVEFFLQSSRVLNWFKDSFCLLRDVGMLCRALTSLVLALTPASPWLKDPPLEKAHSHHQGHDLPYPALCLLIALYHVRTTGEDVFNFAMLEKVFLQQVAAMQNMPVTVRGASVGMMQCSSDLLLSTFETMATNHWFILAAPPSIGTRKQFIKYRAAFDVSVVSKIIQKTGSTSLTRWLKQTQTYL